MALRTKVLALFFSQLSVGVAFAQPRASIQFARFEAEGIPYVELYVTAERASLRPGPEGRRAVELTVLFEEDGKTRVADRLNLQSPIGDTTANFTEALRYPLTPGNYRLRVEGRDLNRAEGDTLSLNLVTPLEVTKPMERAHLSDIQLAGRSEEVTGAEASAQLAKQGRLLEPLAGHVVRRTMNALTAYVEVYDGAGDPSQAWVLEYTVARISDDGKREDILRKTRRTPGGLVTTPIFLNLSTVTLRSAPYLFEVTLRDRALQVVDQKSVVFHVINPTADPEQSVADGGADWTMEIPEDSLDYVLLSLLPVVSSDVSPVISGALEADSATTKRAAIYNHFAQLSPTSPARSYRAYLKVVREVDVAFQSGFRRGFQTDRGQIWLRYGEPNDRIEVSNDPSAPPYEIWIYNYIERTRQTPGKFLFYNPILDNANYVLLHSTVRGEINEPRWRRVLYSRTIGEFGDDDTVQGTNVGDNVGRYADEYFSDF